MIKRVELGAGAMKDLRSVPVYLRQKLRSWVKSVESIGLEETRKSPGLHDEPLQGKRFGQRSIRLNLAYRAIYRIHRDEFGKFALIEEVNKHEY